MPLDDELSDLRYAPRELLVRAIKKMAQDLMSRTTPYKLVLAEYGLMDGEAK